MIVIEQAFTVSYSFPVHFTRDVFAPENTVLTDVMTRAGESRRRALVVIDSGVIGADPGLMERLGRFAEVHGDLVELVMPPLVVRGGEECKREPTLVGEIHSLVERHGICRHSFIIAIGGGALLDAAGYAAATAHRGVRLIRLPTTVLAQNDAGIGVKNGINAFGRKNFLGTFVPPFAVVNDFAFLDTLPTRELRAGIAEAIKVALIRDRAFFDLLHRERRRLAVFEPGAMERMIVRCAELHLEHIATTGDPFEFGSSRPLDFGHWIAHKLEEVTQGEIRHGEAVSVGIALDSLYSRCLGQISDLDLHRIIATLDDVGLPIYHPALAWIDIPRALREFREHLGGELSIPLLDGIGSRIEAHIIDAALYRECVATLAERSKGAHDHERPTTHRAGTAGRRLS